LQAIEIDHERNDIFRAMSQDRLDASVDIDLRPAIEIVRIIQEQDALVAGAVAKQAERIAHAIDQIADRLTHGGRLFYVGAGTSGRIAMLDASELPPTYGISADLVRVLIAGGERAYFSAAEGAEDDEDAAIAEVNREVKADDAVVGIAASGTTPYTVAAVRRANMLGALTVGVTNVAASPLAQHVDIPIVVESGPEVIMGSSRMKSGTAQKLVLNQLSTGVMIRLGHVYSNLMIDMPATNEKLRSRAVRMVELAAGVPRPMAVQAMREADGNVKVATVIAKKKVSADEARALLEQKTLREVLSHGADRKAEALPPHSKTERDA
jgi:N-acetylmuramic acid 6-phosphate etherase